MGLGMSYLRVPPELDGEHDPARIARRVFGDPAWRGRPPASSSTSAARGRRCTI
ncbi:hypothetical protein ACFQHO_36160 [Actinomadura yumaensis]|uniref:hypothetical protein n=1 Tax=Actinomadura yumaensis TaxID=111807 RepID=UPI00360F9EF6